MEKRYYGIFRHQWPDQPAHHVQADQALCCLKTIGQINVRSCYVIFERKIYDCMNIED